MTDDLTAKLAYERDVLAEPAMTANQVTGSQGTRTAGVPEHPMARADYRVDAD